jgi:hypothetical protein
MKRRKYEIMTYVKLFYRNQQFDLQIKINSELERVGCVPLSA